MVLMVAVVVFLFVIVIDVVFLDASTQKEDVVTNAVTTNNNTKKSKIVYPTKIDYQITTADILKEVSFSTTAQIKNIEDVLKYKRVLWTGTVYDIKKHSYSDKYYIVIKCSKLKRKNLIVRFDIDYLPELKKESKIKFKGNIKTLERTLGDVNIRLVKASLE